MRLGVRFHPEWNPRDLVSYAQAVEELGYDELWFSEDCFWPGGMAMASTALAVTTRLRVGVGLFAAPVRNPATAAMEIGALASLAPGRVAATFGHGFSPWMEQIGVKPNAPLPLLEETVDAVRRLLLGELIDVSSERLHLKHVQLGSVPSIPPQVLVGSAGPRGISLGARRADGVVLPELSCRASVRWARELMDTSAGSRELVVFVYLNLDQNGMRAVGAVEPLVRALARTGAFPHLVRLAEIDPFSEDTLSADTVQQMSVSGTRDDCVKSFRSWQEWGVDTLVLLPPTGDGPRQVARFAAEVMPATAPE
jgi:alkanesulfonate monooxygenase SsuD/methylene tetrahydromethanopterin reductase-like flavin-dependent oxidoreductase (luciferase family)